MYFAWKEEYSVNIKEIDEQHKKLFEIGRRVSNMIFSNSNSYSNEDIISIFHDLKNYTEFHFRFEEELLREHGYAHFESHKNEHEMLVERIRKMEVNISENIEKVTLTELINIIFDWISKHILKGDKKYMDLLSDKL